jgi:hypothetical protein
MTVVGRVLGPDGKPVKDAVVDVLEASRLMWDRPDDGTLIESIVVGQCRTDGDGRFRCEVSRAASLRVDGVTAIAAAPGFGFGGASLDDDDERPEAEIKLQSEQVVRARLVDIAGAPAKGVEVRVMNVLPPDEDDGPANDEPPQGTRAWPGPFRTDDQGRVALRGIGRGFNVQLDVRDLRYARQLLSIKWNEEAPGREVTLTLEPAKLIEGRVLAADTGRPIPGAVVLADAFRDGDPNYVVLTARSRTDDQGRFLINPFPGASYSLRAFPTGGEPYLIPEDEIQWPKGAVRTTYDIRLPRGVSIRGRVTERGSDRPLAGSSIQYIPARDRNDVLSGSRALVASRTDGSFQIVVPAGKGHLLICGPSNDYVTEEIGSNRLHERDPSRRRYRAHAIIPYEAEAGGSPPEVRAALRPGVTVEGRVERPDGQAVALGLLFTPHHIEDIDPAVRSGSLIGVLDRRSLIGVLDGRFELHGLDPGGSTLVWILDSEHECGTILEVPGQQAGRPLSVRLQPCGRARVRFVGPDGRTIVGHRPTFELVAAPGPNKSGARAQDQAELFTDLEPMSNIDAEGRLTLVGLIPGALYRISDDSSSNSDKGRQVRKEFTVKPGETLDLGDILIEKPK